MQTRSRGSRLRFRGRAYPESGGERNNPGCGWYHIYTFDAAPPKDGRPVEAEVWMDEACRSEQLALVLIDLSAFRERPLSGEALLHIRRIFSYFREQGRQMILRFVYDRHGEGLLREPADIGLVTLHMEQTGELLREYRAHILVIQGIYVGSWGEMHGSRYLDDVSLCRLAGTLYRVTEGQCFLAVRTPAQWRRIAGSARSNPGLKERLALYNDGMFGSPSDLGTYGTLDPVRAGDCERWSRQAELDWQDTHVRRAPNGGEALFGDVRAGYRQAAEELQKMHVCYLNRIYHPDRLALWKQEVVEEPGCFAGISGYDYIGRRLGYRFVVREAQERGERLWITVENRGFGNLCLEAECVLMEEASDGRIQERRLDTDARTWESGGKTVFAAGLPKERCRLWLKLVRKQDGRSIRFANRDAEDRLLLGEYG